MAYRKSKSTSRSRKSSTRRTVRNNRRPASTRGKRGNARRRTSAQTLRIVIEQPSAISSVTPANQNSPRKAMF